MHGGKRPKRESPQVAHSFLHQLWRIDAFDVQDAVNNPARKDCLIQLIDNRTPERGMLRRDSKGHEDAEEY